MIISTKLTITDLVEQKPVVIFLVSEVCAVPLVSEVICHSLNDTFSMGITGNKIKCLFSHI